jgi:predicted MPP superfamily phosphohydrolase
LPANGLRILHLSDTHFRGIDWREQTKIDCIRRACAGLEYDLLIHTGDFLHEDSGLPNILALLDALPTPRLGGYAVFGNHDYCIYSHDHFIGRAWANFRGQGQCDKVSVPATGNPANGNDHKTNGQVNGNGTQYAHNSSESRITPLTLWQFGQYCFNAPLDFERSGNNDVNALERALAERNIHILHNRYVRLTHPERELDIYLAGVDDVIEGKPKLRHALDGIPYDAPTVLLSHNPDILVEAGIDQVDLLLSGHTHGGQVVLPLVGAAHTQTQFLPRHEVAGYLRRGKTQVYITRGVGEGIPLRFGASPQITLLTLLPA